MRGVRIVDWSPQQVNALDDVGRWIRSGDQQVYRLFGYAGTGKTTLAKHLAAQAPGAVVFAAYTGKAASVMRKSGCWDATTIHSLIYFVQQKSNRRLVEMQLELSKLDDSEENRRTREILTVSIQAEKERVKQPGFVLNPDAEIRYADLIVIDECSMVSAEMAHDLLSFNVPVLALGDPAQLPPVHGKSFFVDHEPDFLLTEIHRQARDNPIVHLATRVRNGQKLEYGTYGESRVVNKKNYTPDWTRDAQVLVGLNKTRIRGNARIRRALGREGDLPVIDDKLVCIRNDHRAGLLNGTLWSVDHVGEDKGDRLELFISNDEGKDAKCVDALKCHFLGEEAPPHAWRTANEFTFGYALTVHKSQGSSWPEVLVVDESYKFPKAQRRSHLYTALTRASEVTTIVT